MAKTEEKIIRYAIEAAAVYVGFTMAANGAFGPVAQNLAAQVNAVLSGTAAASGLRPNTPQSPNAPNTATGSGVAPTHQYTPAGAPPSSFSTGGGTGSTALSQMIANNANFVSQVGLWQGDPRTPDATDWLAFVRYEIAIGAPSPGSNPPAEWPWGIQAMTNTSGTGVPVGTY